MSSSDLAVPDPRARSLDGILDIIEAIPESMCAAPQPKFLFDLASRCTGVGAVVEIGTCAGKSTIALAYAQKTRDRRPIYTIDIAQHPKIEENISRAGVGTFVTRIVLPSRDVAATWTEPVELLWIDGDHSYRGVSTDIDCWAAKVLPGGIMAFHDYPSPGGKTLGGVGRAVYEKVLSRPDQWRVFADRQAGSVLALERLQPVKQTEPGYAATPTFRMSAHRYHARGVKIERGMPRRPNTLCCN